MHSDCCVSSVQVYQFLITSNIPFSALIMVAIAVDRYLCICHPWLSATVMSVRRAKIVVTILGIFSMFIGVIVGLMYGVYHRGSASTITRTVESNQTDVTSTTLLSEPNDSMTQETWNADRSSRTEEAVTGSANRSM